VFGKLFNTAAIISLASVLAGGGFVGYLVASGNLNAERIENIAAVLRGDLDEQPDDTAAEDTAAEEPSPEPRARSEEEVRAMRQRQHLEGLQMERAARDLDARRRLLDQTLQHIVQQQEQLDRDKAEFAAQRRKVTSVMRDEGFQKELDLVSSLQARQAKVHILNVWKKQPADAVRLLTEMDESRAKRILEQLKTPEELQIQSDLLEQIRLRGTESRAE